MNQAMNQVMNQVTQAITDVNVSKNVSEYIYVAAALVLISDSNKFRTAYVVRTYKLSIEKNTKK